MSASAAFLPIAANHIGRSLPEAKGKKARSMAGFVIGFSYGSWSKLLRNSSSKLSTSFFNYAFPDFRAGIAVYFLAA
jgi:hypothetical protein